MPRSFLVKRVGLHHLRATEEDPSSGGSAEMVTRRKKTKRSWDTSLGYSTAGKHDNDGVDPYVPVASQPDANPDLHIFRNKCLGWRKYIYIYIFYITSIK